MKVVLAPFGTRGDVQPMIALGRGLQRRGHEVLLTGPENFGPWAEALGLPFAAAGPDIERQLRSAGDAAGSFAYQVRYLIRELVPRQFNMLPDLCESADLIVGAGIQFAARSVADRMDRPYAYVAYAPVAVPSAHHPPPFIRNQRLPHGMNRVLWRIFGVMAGGMLGNAVRRGRERLGLPPVDDLMAHLSEVPLILAVEPELADPPPDLPPGARVTGPLLLPDDGPLDAELMRFLEAGPAPVFLGFGSMVSDRARELVQLFADAAERLAYRLVVQAGWTGISEAEIRLGQGCKLIGPAPHGVLFPRVRAAVHHGGAGTTTAVARAGIPQQILPHLLDQFYWAHRVRALGLGPRAIPVHRVRRERQVTRLLADLVGTPSYMAHARDLAARLDRLDGVREAIQVLEELVA